LPARIEHFEDARYAAPMTPGSRGFVDHFPSTHETWIGDQLQVLVAGSQTDAREAAQQLRTHIMARYREPLLAYAGASSFRSHSSPEDLVHGFFAERLADLAYLRNWRDSRMKLRRWLCNGLLLHMFDTRAAAQARRARRGRGGQAREA
jgi:hypothetical protein